jgi:excinuclease UvrABC ATPase subunit
MAVPESLTGQYMSGKRKIEVPKQRVRRSGKSAEADRRAATT